MELSNRMNISGNVPALSQSQTVAPHATAQANQEAVRTAKPEQGRTETRTTPTKASPDDLAEKVQEHVDEINSQLKNANHSIRFSIDEKSDDLVVKVVDTKTDKVIREIPPEEVLRLREHMKELSGMIVAEKA